jgi:hypothetical protein
MSYLIGSKVFSSSGEGTRRVLWQLQTKSRVLAPSLEVTVSMEAHYRRLRMPSHKDVVSSLYQLLLEMCFAVLVEEGRPTTFTGPMASSTSFL